MVGVDGVIGDGPQTVGGKEGQRWRRAGLVKALHAQGGGAEEDGLGKGEAEDVLLVVGDALV